MMMFISMLFTMVVNRVSKVPQGLKLAVNNAPSSTPINSEL